MADVTPGELTERLFVLHPSPTPYDVTVTIRAAVSAETERCA